MHNRSIAEIAAALDRREVSSEELTRHFLGRIARLDGQLNSFVTVTGEQALSQAREADRRRAAGAAGPLTGIPMAHKDIFCTLGVRTSCGSRMLDPFVAPYDATVVERVAAATVELTNSSARANRGTVCDRSRMWMPLRSPKM